MKKKLVTTQFREFADGFLERARLRRAIELKARRIVASVPLKSEQKRQLKALADLGAQAETRLGSSSIRRLQWLVQLSQLSAEDLARELHDPTSPRLLELSIFAARSGAIQALETLRRGLDSLADGFDWELDYPGRVRSRLRRTTEQRETGTFGRLTESFEANDGPTEFLMRAKELVRLEGARLARCEVKECRRVFVRRKRALFCDTKCAQRERQRIWRIETDAIRAREAQGTVQRSKTKS